MADFVRTVAAFDPTAIERYKTVDTAYTTTGTKTITVTLTNGLSAGWVRIRTKAVNAATTNTFNVSLTDGGSNTQEILPTTVATAGGVASHILVPFLLDFQAATATITVVVGTNGNETVDVEVSGSR